MKPITRLLCTAGAVSFACLAHAGPPTVPAATAAMLDAAANYRKGELGAAFNKFSSLANQGNSEAARVALFMHVQGPALYGRYWAASPEEVRRWRESVIAASHAPVRSSVAAERAP